MSYAKDQPADFTNRIEKVAIVGAGGHLGSHFTRALLGTGKHSVTALTRAGSTSTLPAGIAVATVDYDNPASLAAGIRGHDLLIITLSVRAPRDTASKLYAAAAAAGVRYVMPNCYGPNPFNTPVFDDMGFGPEIRAGLANLASHGLTPVLLTCGFWYEFSLSGGTSRYGFDLANKKVVFFDDGAVPIYTSTWPQCGRAVAALLSLPVLPTDAADAQPTLSQYAGPDKTAYVSSFHVSQQDMFASLKRVTGTTDSDWTVTHEPVKERYAAVSKALQGFLSGKPTGATGLDGTPLTFMDAFAGNMYTRIFFPGADGVTESMLANKALGLPEEDLDEWSKEAVRMATDGDLQAYGA